MRCTGIQQWKVVWKRASQSRRFPACFQSVERTIYRRMERCGLRAHIWWWAWSERDESGERFSFLRRTNVEISSQRKWHQSSVTKTDFRPQTSNPETLDPETLDPETSGPSNIFFQFIYIANSSQFLSPNVLWSRNVQRQQPERIEIYIFSGLSLSHRSNSENLTRFKIAADTLINEVCWRMFYRRNRKSESL